MHKLWAFANVCVREEQKGCLSCMSHVVRGCRRRCCGYNKGDSLHYQAMDGSNGENVRCKNLVALGLLTKGFGFNIVGLF